MTAGSRRGEFWGALRATGPFLLSHHLPADYHRCYTVSKRRGIRLCARCTGIYPGIAIGFGLFAFSLVPGPRLAWIALLPLPALVEWTAITATDRRGSNPLRTLTGGMLGVGYGGGLYHLLATGSLVVVLLGFVYGTVALGLLRLFDETPI